MKRNWIIIFSLACLDSTNSFSQGWQWARSAGDYIGNDAVRSTNIDASGKIYATGNFGSNTITFGSYMLTNACSSCESMDIFLAKYDANGDVLWAKGFGGIDNDYPQSVTTDASGNVYVAGWFESSSLNFGTFTLTRAGSASTSDIFLVKFDSSGNVIWATSAGGASDDDAFSVTTDFGGGVYITGYFTSASIVFGSAILSNPGAFVAKYDSSGNVLWARETAGSSNNSIAYTIKTDSAKSVYIAGYYTGATVTFGATTLTNSGINGDIFLAKYDSAGNSIWAKSATGIDNDAIEAISIDRTGSICATGFFSSATIVFGTETLTNIGGEDAFLVKFDSSGNTIWARSAGSYDDDRGNAIANDDSGNIYITGYFDSTTLSIGSYTLTGGEGANIFLAKYNSLGDFAWANSEGTNGTGSVFADAINISTSGDVYIAGGFESINIAFGSTILANSDSFGGTYDLFLAKYSESTTFTPTLNNYSSVVSIYPNPAVEQINIDFGDSNQIKYTAELFDAAGKLQKTYPGLSNRATLSLDGLASGVYECSIICNNIVVSNGKIVVVR